MLVAAPPTYKPHLKHRNATPGASQWTISLPDENASFALSWESGWCHDRKGWGLHFINGIVTCLGYVENHRSPVCIAKFVGDGESLTWHGYPADRRKPQDIPIEPIRKLWLKILPAAKIRKIVKGEPWKP